MNCRVDGAEVWALMQALGFAKELGLQDIIIEGIPLFYTRSYAQWNPISL